MDENTASSDFVLQWGNGKRLRCMKFQSNSKESSGSGRPMTRIDRRVIRSDTKNHKSMDPNTLHAAAGKSHGSDRYLNLRQRPASPSHPVLRNSEAITMRGHSNGVKTFVSPDRGDKKGGTAKKNSNINTNHQNDNHHHYGSGSGGSGSSETAQEGKKGGALAGSEEGINAVWPPKFLIASLDK